MMKMTKVDAIAAQQAAARSSADTRLVYESRLTYPKSDIISIEALDALIIEWRKEDARLAQIARNTYEEYLKYEQFKREFLSIYLGAQNDQT
jgi:hypothetical protein